MRSFTVAFPHLSLRARTMMAILLPLTIVFGVMTAVEYRRYRSDELANAAVLGTSVGRSLETSIRQLLRHSDFTGIESVMVQMAETGRFHNSFLLNTDGVVLAHPDTAMASRQMSYNEPECQSCHPGDDLDRPSSIVVTGSDGEQMLRVIYPLNNSEDCSRCHAAEETTLGLLITDVPLRSLQGQLVTSLRESIFWWFASFGAVFIGVYVVLDRQVLNRLGRLSRAMTSFDTQAFEPLHEQSKDDEIGQLFDAFNEMALEVQQHSRHSAALSERLSTQSQQRGKLLERMIAVQENERRRIALELHDELGQILTGVNMQLTVIRKNVASDPATSAAQLEMVQSHITHGIDKMYEVIVALRPSDLDDLGLTAALRNLTERTLAGTDIDYEIEYGQLDKRLAPALETAVYRTCQEALNNVVRHSMASHVRLELARRNGYLEGEIRDNGQGFDLTTLKLNGDHPRGLGILGMQERISQCGGRIDILSRPGAGTRVKLQVPWVETFDE